ncbi:MAG: hypothetical protein Q8N96_07690, partial [Methylovulum sp.]|nr:hypothetical protein [Methylovulum sp.]
MKFKNRLSATRTRTILYFVTSDEIRRCINTLTGLHAKLAEIDENLVRDDLTAWEQSVWLADRKRVYLELYPETAREATLKQNRSAESAERSQQSFVESTATKTNISDRVIRENIQIATNL